MIESIQKIQALSNEIGAAERKLASAIANRWPIGAIVRARMGGNLLELRVSGPAYDPARFWAVNTKTNACRKVHFSDVIESEES